jgi:hypothetical protein
MHLAQLLNLRRDCVLKFIVLNHVHPSLQRRKTLPGIPSCLAACHVHDLMSLASYRAGCTFSRASHAWVCGDLVLVVANGSLGDRADILRASL